MDEGVVLDAGTHADFQCIMTNNEAEISKMFPEGSFQHIFGKRQQEAAPLKNACSMRWHYLIIKWCLYLQHVSGHAYETSRSSGCIHLLSRRTLPDYTHFVSASTGFSDYVNAQLALAPDVDYCPEHEKYTVIVFDEMYIKEELVYNKHNGTLVGFTDLGETNSHLL